MIGALDYERHQSGHSVFKNCWREKTKKHLQIGIAVKSLAGSRRVIELLTRTE